MGTTRSISAVFLWIGVIFFSSTSLAAKWCEDAFHFLASIIFRGLTPQDASLGLIHLLADKGVHVGMFLVLAVLLWNVVPNKSWKVAVILLCGAAVGSASEFLQRFFPGRDPAIRDVLINIAGTGVGVIVCISLWKNRVQTETPAYSNLRSSS